MRKFEYVKMNEDTILNICKDFYELWRSTNRKVDDYLFAEFGPFAEFDLFGKLQENIITFYEKEYTIANFREKVLEQYLNEFWENLSIEYRVSFLVAFPCSRFRVECTLLEFLQVDNVFEDENELMADAINYFYMIMRLLCNQQDSGFNIFNKIIRHRISDGKEFKFVEFRNNSMIINPSISLSENQKILQKKYKELEIIKINSVQNMEELEGRLRLYIFLYILREKHNFTFSEIDCLFGEYGFDDFDFKNKEDNLKKIWDRKIKEIIKILTSKV